VSGTDYAPATSGSAILKGNGSGGFSSAASGTDYAPATSGSAILKGNGSGGFSNAASGTDYAPATSGTSILKGNGSGGFSNATSGTDYAPAALDVKAKTANYTMTNSEDVVTLSGTFTITMHAVSSATKKPYRFINIGTGTITFAFNGSDTCAGDTSIQMAPGGIGNYPSFELIPDGTSAWLMF
jgi:hypothetical protein